MNHTDPADDGVIKALKLRGLPEHGIAIELGFGSARNLRAMSRIWPGKTIGYELDPDWIELAKKNISLGNFEACVEYGDINQLTLEPNSLAAVVIGVMIYQPKSVGIALLKKVWQALQPKGFLHVEFATPKDHAALTDFFEYTCAPFPEEGYPNSYGHYCGFFTCQYDHPGVIGASFWEPSEALGTIQQLGKGKIIHTELREFNQADPDEGAERLRSFYLVTYQKS